VDTPERIATFLNTVDRMMNDGMVTIEEAKVKVYRASNEQKV